jgi:hypothetical protein
MATNFPTSLDSLTNPAAGDSLSSPSHAGQHANVNDAVEALEAKVGVDGSAVTTSLDYKVANQGLTLVKTQTVGSGVSSVTVTGAFSSTFQNYKVHYFGGTASTPNDIAVRLGATSTGYYMGHIFMPYAGSSVSAASVTNGSQWTFAGCQDSPNTLDCDIMMPFEASITTISCHYAGAGTGRVVSRSGGMLNNTTSYTDLVLLAGAGTLTGGTIRVYGYNNG